MSSKSRNREKELERRAQYEAEEQARLEENWRYHNLTPRERIEEVQDLDDAKRMLHELNERISLLENEGHE